VFFWQARGSNLRSTLLQKRRIVGYFGKVQLSFTFWPCPRLHVLGGSFLLLGTLSSSGQNSAELECPRVADSARVMAANFTFGWEFQVCQI